jgi:hypothetical protein
MLMRKRLGTILIVVACLFFCYAIFGRYIVLPGYIESLEAGQDNVSTATENVEGWKIARYLLWAYSCKLGVFFLIVGALLKTSIKPARFWLFTIAGFIYIAFAYIPLPATVSIVFGIVGVLMTVLIVLMTLSWARERDQLPLAFMDSSDYRMAGYFFFAMATYTVCSFMGIRIFALQPEKMIQYGLQADAAAFALHLLVELVLGWVFSFAATKTGI